MEGIIKVSSEKLSSAAGEFGTQGNTVRTITDNMLNLASGLISVWEGEAAQTYMRKFNELEDDMQRIFRMIQEHSEDLKEMAANYQNADRQNEEAAAALGTDIIR